MTSTTSVGSGSGSLLPFLDRKRTIAKPGYSRWMGPVLINYIREYNITHGTPKAQAYNTTMYIMAGLLVVGFICNFFVKAVDKRYHMKSEAGLSGAIAQTAKA